MDDPYELLYKEVTEIAEDTGCDLTNTLEYIDNCIETGQIVDRHEIDEALERDFLAM